MSYWSTLLSSMNLLNHHFPNMLEIPVMFSQLTNLTSSLMEWIPQREKERGSRERQEERGRESSREDWSPLRNTGYQLNRCRQRAQTTQTFARRPKTSQWSRVELGEEEKSRSHDSHNCATTFSAVLAVAVWDLEHNRWVKIPLHSD